MASRGNRDAAAHLIDVCGDDAGDFPVWSEKCASYDKNNENARAACGAHDYRKAASLMRSGRFLEGNIKSGLELFTLLKNGERTGEGDVRRGSVSFLPAWFRSTV